MEERAKKTLFREKVRLATNAVARFLAETRGFRPRSNAQVVARRATEFFTRNAQKRRRDGPFMTRGCRDGQNLCDGQN
jgi:hypothetical protein